MRYLVLALPLALLAGCIVRTGPYRTYGSPAPAPYAAPRAEVYYYGNHFIPESAGGGWCYIDGPHTHDYYPERDDWYDYDQGYYWYRGPFLFSFFGGHPLPGGSWCFIQGPHQHDYYPPAGSDWRWNRTGFVYEGSYRPNRPPPPTYWARPAPRVDWGASRPRVRPSPAPLVRPRREEFSRPLPARPPERGFEGRPGPAAGPRFEEERSPAPAPEARPWPGRSGEAPGHGGTLPPGQGGVPPGQSGRPELAPPARDERHDRAAPPPARGPDAAKESKDKKEKKDREDEQEKGRGPRSR
jgi:hypothetical protein